MARLIFSPTRYRRQGCKEQKKVQHFKLLLNFGPSLDTNVEYIHKSINQRDLKEFRAPLKTKTQLSQKVGWASIREWASNRQNMLSVIAWKVTQCKACNYPLPILHDAWALSKGYILV